MSILEDREKHDGTTCEYYFAVYLNVMDWLVEEYRKDYVATAKLCDEKIDRSGRLLGRVRELARRTPQESET
jgi:hypothetical protein